MVGIGDEVLGGEEVSKAGANAPHDEAQRQVMKAILLATRAGVTVGGLTEAFVAGLALVSDVEVRVELTYPRPQKSASKTKARKP